MEKQDPLPKIATEYIDAVIRKMRYRKKVRAEVRQELTDHFADTLADCKSDEERNDIAKGLIAGFGDAKLLGTLLRRGKKRCRPLWQKIFWAVVKTAGIIILLFLLRIGYMATGRPTISVDYAQWMNDKVRDGRDESQNAYHDYQKAIKAFPEDVSAGIEKIFTYVSNQEKTPKDWEAIENFLKNNSKAIEVFRQGTSKPYYWNKYEYKTPEKSLTNMDFSPKVAGEFSAGVVSALMPRLSGHKKIARIIVEFKIPFNTHQGNIKQAINDSIALYRFGQHISGQGVIIEELVGITIKAMTMAGIQDLLRQAELSAEDLLRIQHAIENDYDCAVAEINWSLEKAFWYDLIQRSFTDDGKGNGRPTPIGAAISLSGDYKDFAKGFITGFPDRKQTTIQIDDCFKGFESYRSITPYAIQQDNQNQISNLQQDFSLMMQVTIPATQKTVEIGWRVRVHQAGLLGTLAILRFEKENNRLPDSLEELKQKGYLHKMPMDPYSDKPLVYKKTDDGFMLYSVGMDFNDDGGAPSTDNNGKPRQWGENGDWIFWPVNAEE